MTPSPRVVSLAELLQETDLQTVVKAVSILASSMKRFGMIRHAMITGSASFGFVSEEEINMVLGSITRIKTAAEKFEMSGVVRGADRTHSMVSDIGFGKLPEHHLLILAENIHILVAAFGDELDSRKLFTMTPRFSAYYDPDAPLFGEGVDDAFPSSASEIQEAGKCLALGRWTACVMHLMRALEPAITCLSKFSGVDPGENWNTILNHIEANLKKIGKKTHNAEDEQFAAEAATHFRSIKNAWRNHAMHARERYDEERAVAIYDSVRSFMRHLATRLKE